MNCPKCADATKVVDSRPQIEATYRRRRCKNCGFRFSTIEIPSAIAQEILATNAQHQLIARGIQAFISAAERQTTTGQRYSTLPARKPLHERIKLLARKP